MPVAARPPAPGTGSLRSPFSPQAPDLHRPLPGSPAFRHQPSWASSLHTAKGGPLSLCNHVGPFL